MPSDEDQDNSVTDVTLLAIRTTRCILRIWSYLDTLPLYTLSLFVV